MNVFNAITILALLTHNSIRIHNILKILEISEHAFKVSLPSNQKGEYCFWMQVLFSRYERLDPEANVLYQVSEDKMEQFFVSLESDLDQWLLSNFVRKEFGKFLRCRPFTRAALSQLYQSLSLKRITD